MEIAMRQITFACQSSFEKYARPSRREQFLQTMESVVPWSELEARIEPHYPKAGNGRQPVGLGIMLRIYFLQHWFNLSDPGDEFETPDVVVKFSGPDVDLLLSNRAELLLAMEHVTMEHLRIPS